MISAAEILIPGGRGFLGSDPAEDLRSRGHGVSRLNFLPSGCTTTRQPSAPAIRRIGEGVSFPELSPNRPNRHKWYGSGVIQDLRWLARAAVAEPCGHGHLRERYQH